MRINAELEHVRSLLVGCGLSADMFSDTFTLGSSDFNTFPFYLTGADQRSYARTTYVGLEVMDRIYGDFIVPVILDDFLGSLRCALAMVRRADSIDSILVAWEPCAGLEPWLPCGYKLFKIPGKSGILNVAHSGIGFILKLNSMILLRK